MRELKERMHLAQYHEMPYDDGIIKREEWMTPEEEIKINKAHADLEAMNKSLASWVVTNKDYGLPLICHALLAQSMALAISGTSLKGACNWARAFINKAEESLKDEEKK